MTLQIDFHPSVREGILEEEAIESLRANRIDSKLLYITPRQSELWRQVFLRHSPIHGNPEFARIYREAFEQAAMTIPKRIWLVGLGSGTGMKEAQLCREIKMHGCDVLFSAVDVSRDLVVESAQNLAAAGAELEPCLVCDLSPAIFLRQWLDETGLDAPRLYAFFGLVPNLAPSVVVRLFQVILRPGDVLLVSAHLAPVGEGIGISEAMRSVFPQYDNPETLAWLTTALEQWNLKDLVEAPEMKIGEVDGVPAFAATARWKSSVPFERWGHIFSPRKEEPLRLFHSLRFTPSLFEKRLRDEGFSVELLAMTACREEAIWSVRKPA